MSNTTVEDCEEAMKNVEIDDKSLVAMFHSCLNAKRLVRQAVQCNSERAVRLLIAERFDLSHVDEFRSTLLHEAYPMR
jgi:hypothetical protein